MARAPQHSLWLGMACAVPDANRDLVPPTCLQVADFLNGRWTWADARQLLMPTAGPGASLGQEGRSARRESIRARSAAQHSPDPGGSSQRSSAVGGASLHSTPSVAASAADLAEVGVGVDVKHLENWL